MYNLPTCSRRGASYLQRNALWQFTTSTSSRDITACFFQIPPRHNHAVTGLTNTSPNYSQTAHLPLPNRSLTAQGERFANETIYTSLWQQATYENRLTTLSPQVSAKCPKPLVASGARSQQMQNGGTLRLCGCVLRSITRLMRRTICVSGLATLQQLAIQPWYRRLSGVWAGQVGLESIVALRRNHSHPAGGEGSQNVEWVSSV